MHRTMYVQFIYTGTPTDVARDGQIIVGTLALCTCLRLEGTNPDEQRCSLSVTNDNQLEHVEHYTRLVLKCQRCVHTCQHASCTFVHYVCTYICSSYVVRALSVP